MAGAHEEKEPAAAGGRSRPGEVRKSAVVHATARRYVDVQEPALPQALRDYRRAERRVSGLGHRPSPPVSLSRSSQSRRARDGYRSTRQPAFPSKRARKSCLASHNFFTPHFSRTISPGLSCTANFPPECTFCIQWKSRESGHFSQAAEPARDVAARQPFGTAGAPTFE